MSVRTPIFTKPSDSLSAAAAPPARPRAAAAARASDTRARPLIFVFLSPRSDAEEALQRVHPALELGPCDDVDDAPALEQEVAVRERGDEAEVLLDEDDGVAAVLQGPDGAP